jgi:hypothetical protein
MTIPEDPFHPDNLKLLETQLAAGNGKKATAARRIADHERIEFYKFPAWVLNNILTVAGPRANQYAILAVLMALFELWYTSGRWDGRHRNPVKLTSTHVKRRFGLSRWQKIRTLAIFERAGAVNVDYRSRGQNPWVTLNWEGLA